MSTGNTPDQPRDSLTPSVPPVDDGKRWITVILDNGSPQIRKNLHCVNCGRIVLNYYSEARLIIVGQAREVSRPQDIMCSRCATMHRII